MLIPLGMLLLGLFLSAFFSGSETGFYRATRMKLVLDGLSGSLTARFLLFLTNNPALFVATALIGNNFANYLVSLAIVVGAERLFAESSSLLVELAAPLVLAPVLFVYGELLPKSLFFRAPNRLLRLGAPLMFLFTAAFLPVAVLLWGLGRLLQWVVGEAPEQVSFTLARKELLGVLEEGHASGVLQPVQRRLAQAVFSTAADPVVKFCVPPGRLPAVRRGTSTAEVLRLARRQRSPLVLVFEGTARRVVGYVRIIDLRLSGAETVEEVRPLLRVESTRSQIEALLAMQNERAPLAQVVDSPGGEPLGYLFLRPLTELLFGFKD